MQFSHLKSKTIKYFTSKAVLCKFKTGFNTEGSYIHVGDLHVCFKQATETQTSQILWQSGSRTTSVYATELQVAWNNSGSKALFKPVHKLCGMNSISPWFPQERIISAFIQPLLQCNMARDWIGDTHLLFIVKKYGEQEQHRLTAQKWKELTPATHTPEKHDATKQAVATSEPYPAFF